MILIDSNALVVLILGLIDERLIETHKRTSIYNKEDFHQLVRKVHNLQKLIVLPQVWAETDNLLNNFKGSYKRDYIFKLQKLIELTTEKYLETKSLIGHENLWTIGITDALLFEVAKDCEYVITSDSKLADLIRANGIGVYDMVKKRNERFE